MQKYLELESKYDNFELKISEFDYDRHTSFLIAF